MHVVHELGPEVDALLERREFFWLDLRHPTPEQIREAGRRFGLDRLAVEDTLEQGQRAKYDDYGDTALMVVFGMGDQPWPCEVHLHLGDGWMVTVHTPPCPALDEAEERFRRDPPHSHEEAVYRVVDALTDSFFAPLDAMEDDIDDLLDELIERPGRDERHRLFQQRRRIVGLRRILTPQRDMLAHVDERLGLLPGMDAEHARTWLRDVFDHTQRLVEQTDALRDLLASALDVSLSASSNRLNEVMKRLTIISVVFLPLTFVTGFFGQNFGWLVDHIASPGAFLGLTTVTLLVPVAGMWWWFRRSGFLED